MEDRVNEINFVVNMVQNICIEAKIALVAKEVKGQLMVVVQDSTTEKEYYMGKVKKWIK